MVCPAIADTNAVQELVHPNEHAGGFDDGVGGLAFLELERTDGFAGD